MKSHMNRLRTSVSLVLIGAVLTVFSFTSFAAFEPSPAPLARPEAAYLLLQAPTGTLTKAKSGVSINGTAATEGATVLDGSLMRTVTGSRALVDIPTLGNVDYGESTESVLTLSDKRIAASLNQCGAIKLTLLPDITGTVKVISASDVGVFSERKEIDVKVFRGQVLVKRQQNQENLLTKGAHEEYDDAIEVTAIGDAEFIVYCREDHYVGLFFLPALGLLLLPFGNADVLPVEEPPVLSPLQP